ncbi:hypothetical protein AGR8A_pTi20156 [Agrobacterium fabrum str. J-07]|nr:hypothetical protein AGR8A_pTi20156 [Agrobacterium fabrum str. J-07]
MGLKAFELSPDPSPELQISAVSQKAQGDQFLGSQSLAPARGIEV